MNVWLGDHWSWKKAQAPQECLGNILDGWGTFYAVLLHFTVCRELCIFHKVFKVKMGTLSPKKWLWLIGPNIWDITIIPCILLKFEWNWITNPGRDFWKCQCHALCGTFWNPQSLPGEHKGTFFMSARAASQTDTSRRNLPCKPHLTPLLTSRLKSNTWVRHPKFAANSEG